jgi:hypothetical protein
MYKHFTRVRIRGLFKVSSAAKREKNRARMQTHKDNESQQITDASKNTTRASPKKN